MGTDLRTGLEIELVLPPGHGRLTLGQALADRFGLELEPFLFATKVPVPELDRSRGSADNVASATIRLIQDIAAHHQAKVQSVSADFRFFFLAHRAARLREPDGAPVLSIVHDNTLTGGERVAELVTAPFVREQMPRYLEIFQAVEAIEGISIPDEAALHIHLDGAQFMNPSTLTRLVLLYQSCEPGLLELARKPAALKRAKPLPEDFVRALVALANRREEWPAVESLIRTFIPTREFGLNLYNLAAGEADKLTVELKVCGSTLSAPRIAALRELFVALAARALDSERGASLPGAAVPLARALVDEVTAQALLSVG